jgi:hypothetical protein
MAKTVKISLYLNALIYSVVLFVGLLLLMYLYQYEKFQYFSIVTGVGFILLITYVLYIVVTAAKRLDKKLKTESVNIQDCPDYWKKDNDSCVPSFTDSQNMLTTFPYTGSFSSKNFNALNDTSKCTFTANNSWESLKKSCDRLT